jgi:hypothetical protein
MEKKTNQEIIDMVINVNLKEALQHIVVENEGVLELHDARNGSMELTVYANFFRMNHLKILSEHCYWNECVVFDKEKQLMHLTIDTKF